MAASPTTFRSARSMLAARHSCCSRDVIVSCREIRHGCTCSHLHVFRCQHGTTPIPTDCRQRSISGGGTGSDSRRASHDEPAESHACRLRRLSAKMRRGCVLLLGPSWCSLGHEFTRQLPAAQCPTLFVQGVGDGHLEPLRDELHDHHTCSGVVFALSHVHRDVDVPQFDQAIDELKKLVSVFAVAVEVYHGGPAYFPSTYSYAQHRGLDAVIFNDLTVGERERPLEYSFESRPLRFGFVLGHP